MILDLDVLRAMASMHEAEISPPSTPETPPVAFFPLPETVEQLIVVIGGNEDGEVVNLRNALNVADKIFRSPERPPHVAVAASANSGSDSETLTREFDMLLDELRPKGKTGAALDEPSAGASLIVIPLTQRAYTQFGRPFVPTANCGWSPRTPDRIPVSAVVATSYWADETDTTPGLSDRIGLVRPGETTLQGRGLGGGGEDSPLFWRRLAAAVRIADGLGQLELEARAASAAAVASSAQAGSLLLQQGISPGHFVVGSYTPKNGAIPIHAVLRGRAATGIELVPRPLTDDEIEIEEFFEKRAKAGIATVRFDTPNPPPTFVNEVRNDLERVTGLPITVNLRRDPPRRSGRRTPAIGPEGGPKTRR